MQRIVLFGNSGSGKTTMARGLAREFALPHLDLDSLAWERPGVRRSTDESAGLIREFVAAHAEWVIEEAQDQMLGFLLAWVRDYESRTDEYSLERHRQLFEDELSSGIPSWAQATAQGWYQ